MRAGEKQLEENRYIPDPPPVMATIFPLMGKSPTFLDAMLMGCEQVSFTACDELEDGST
jgi:hypothetical protein